MKKILIAFLSVLVLLSCKKAAELRYDAPDNIYFDFDPNTSDRDSIVYTFAYEPGKASDTIFLPVRISGNRIPEDRTFRIQEIAEGTTALSGIHYEALRASYTMPADSGRVYVPVILYNTDPELTQKSVTLQLTLVETPDFGLQITGLEKGKILFSAKLEKPFWWEMWLGPYYSQVKHELFLISSGTIHMTTDGLDAPKNLYHVGRLNSFMNDPFSWVAQHPDAGYVLEKQSESSYHFFSSGNPAKKIELRKNEQSGRYFFIDENGQEVN